MRKMEMDTLKSIFLMLLVMGILLIIAENATSSTNKETAERLGDVEQYGGIENVILLVSEPQVKISCAKGVNDQTIYSAELNGMQIRSENGQDIYVGIIFKGARARTEESFSLSPSETAGIGTAGQLSFLNMLSDSPPLISRQDVKYFAGVIKPFQSLIYRNNFITLTNLEERGFISKKCTATLTVKCSAGEEHPMFLTLEEDDEVCQTQDDKSSCERIIDACTTNVKVRLDAYSNPSALCTDKQPVFFIESSDIQEDWKIGEPLDIIFWRNTPEAQQCWQKSILDPYNDCINNILGGYRLYVNAANYAACAP